MSRPSPRMETKIPTQAANSTINARTSIKWNRSNRPYGKTNSPRPSRATTTRWPRSLRRRHFNRGGRSSFICHKSEIRISKSETNSKFEDENPRQTQSRNQPHVLRFVRPGTRNKQTQDRQQSLVPTLCGCDLFAGVSPFAPRKGVLSRSERRHWQPWLKKSQPLCAGTALRRSCGTSGTHKRRNFFFRASVSMSAASLVPQSGKGAVPTQSVGTRGVFSAEGRLSVSLSVFRFVSNLSSSYFEFVSYFDIRISNFPRYTLIVACPGCQLHGHSSSDCTASRTRSTSGTLRPTGSGLALDH